MARSMSLPLQELIASLDKNCLPIILQVCSGVYFQGSVYEISGCEVSFSTGDLIKVIGLELLSICCEDFNINERFELPINHTGLFKIIPEEMPYNSIKEMMTLRPVPLESNLPFTFTSSSKLTFDDFTVGEGTALTVFSTEEDKLRCKVHGHNEASAEVFVPLSLQGEFMECESEECFTLQEIMSEPSLLCRRFRSISSKCDRQLLLTPVYQVHAVMNLRKDILKFPSSLEVDVVDVTEDCKDMIFERPLSLTQVLSEPKESFPVVVKILEHPKSFALQKCSWLQEISQCQSLVFHKAGATAMALLSSMKNRKTQKYFLVSDIYGGRFRRLPREFNSVYELYVASVQAPGLRVSVTRNSMETEESLPVLNVGEQLEVVCCKRLTSTNQSNTRKEESVEGLLCQRLPGPNYIDDDDDDDDDDDCLEHEKQEVILPLYMQSHFVEVLSDNRKYRLKDLGKVSSLPLDVKVVNRDAELQNDPLPGLPGLRIERTLFEPTILASFLHSPECCFEIPARWISMDVSFTTDAMPWPHDDPPNCLVESVTEVTNTFFYELCKRDSTDAPPPPRPPKSHNDPASQKADKPKHPEYQKQKSIPIEKFAGLTLNAKRPPARLPSVMSDELTHEIPHKQSTMERKNVQDTRIKDIKKNVPLQDPEESTDHDYEVVEEHFKAMLKKPSEDVRFYY